MINVDNVYKYIFFYFIRFKGINIIYNYGVIK